MRTRSLASFSIAGVLVAAGWVLVGDAQSPTPFGIPNAGVPAPTAGITAVPGSRAQGWLAQGRSEVLARHGMVATSDPLASQAGLEVLRQGGNAIDAAVATGAVLDVTSQNDTGIGGDLFAIVWVAKEQKLYALNAAGRAPAGWTPEFFTGKLGVKRVPGNGVNAATVPGAVAGYDALLKRFGTMTFKETFERAARIADEGWGQAERRHDDIRGALTGLKADPDSKQVFLNGEDAPALYSIIRNPNLSKALRLIQAEGKDAFYKGAIAEAIVQKVQSNGGVMTREDLAKYEPEWVEPVTTSYHGYDIYQLPPPGQGFAALEMLNILEVCVPKLGFNLAPARAVEPDVLAPDGRGQEAGLRRPAGQERRSEVLHDSGAAAALEVARGQPLRAHRPEPRQQADRCRAAPRAGPSTSPPPIAGATWCRWCTACSASTAAAPASGRTGSSSTTAARPSRSNPASEPGRARQAAVPLDHRRAS